MNAASPVCRGGKNQHKSITKRKRTVKAQRRTSVFSLYLCHFIWTFYWHSFPKWVSYICIYTNKFAVLLGWGWWHSNAIEWHIGRLWEVWKVAWGRAWDQSTVGLSDVPLSHRDRARAENKHLFFTAEICDCLPSKRTWPCTLRPVVCQHCSPHFPGHFSPLTVHLGLLCARIRFQSLGFTTYSQQFRSVSCFVFVYS